MWKFVFGNMQSCAHTVPTTYTLCFICALRHFQQSFSHIVMDLYTFIVFEQETSLHFQDIRKKPVSRMDTQMDGQTWKQYTPPQTKFAGGIIISEFCKKCMQNFRSWLKHLQIFRRICWKKQEEFCSLGTYPLYTSTVLRRGKCLSLLCRIKAPQA